MYTSKKAVLVGMLLSMIASGIKAESHDDNAEYRFSFCSTSSCTETHPTLQICGNFFSFETRGGSMCNPTTSCVSGEGGIFIDHNGTIAIGQPFRANIGAMITRSSNGVIDLPADQVFFCNNMSITNWDIDLNDPMQEVVVRADENLAEFFINWRDVCKDYDVFCPFIISNINACSCPAVLPCNVTGVPTIEGSVGRLILSGSSLASPVTVKVSGGNVGELLFSSCPEACQAPVGVLIVEGNATIGLGTAECNANNQCVVTGLGSNALTIIANGSASINLQEDITINSGCSILRGPDFMPGDVLRFDATGTGRTITVTSTGVLDLRSFDAGDIIEFGDSITIILQPGAEILLDGATLRLTESACIRIQGDPQAQQIFENGFSQDVIVTDPFRVKLIGVGTIELDDCSCFVVEPNGFAGVETLFDVNASTVCQFASTSTANCDMIFTQTCEIPVTNITIAVEDSAQFVISTDASVNNCSTQSMTTPLLRQAQSLTRLGGSFQVGNTTNRPGHSVSFTLLIDGDCAQAVVGSSAFFGLNEGIVSKTGVPSNWLIDVLFNVTSIVIDVEDGVFSHNRIFDTDSSSASILAIGQSPDDAARFSLLYTGTGGGEVCGGGNVVLQPNTCVGPQNPIVRAVNDVNTDSCLRVGILASTPMLPAGGIVDVDAVTFFEDITAQDILTFGLSQSLAAVGEQASQCSRIPSSVRAGFIFMDQIVRTDVADIIGECGCLNLNQALLDCAAFVRVTNPNNPQDSTIFSNL
jgi:hypothetical protein